MFKKTFQTVRDTVPLIHNITNYVTVNDVANALLACGASPIMSDDAMEVEEITSICGGLNINIGTLNQNTIPSMFLAGKKANELNHKVLLDPVGAGASSLRTKTAMDLIEKVKFDVIRGNISEIKAIAGSSSNTKGVDASSLDAVTEENLDEAVSFMKDLARRFGCVVAATGEFDLVSDSERCFVIVQILIVFWKQLLQQFVLWDLPEKLLLKNFYLGKEIQLTETKLLMQFII